jgi:hypothetical protein
VVSQIVVVGKICVLFLGVVVSCPQDSNVLTQVVNEFAPETPLKITADAS